MHFTIVGFEDYDWRNVYEAPIPDSGGVFFPEGMTPGFGLPLRPYPYTILILRALRLDIYNLEGEGPTEVSF